MALDQTLGETQAALLDRLAPSTRTRRLRWSYGSTQALEAGAGPPLLLLHGGLDAAVTWAPILERLSAHHRVIAVDLPGHGLADSYNFARVDLLEHAVTFVRDVLDALELRKVDLVASSIGALYAVSFALDARERVTKLVLAGAPAGLKRPGVPLQLRLLGLPLIGQPLGRRLMSKPTRDGNRKFWGQILVVHPERLDDGVLDADVAGQLRNTESHLSLVASIADSGGLRRNLIFGERWMALSTSTLILWGERDAFLAPRDGERIAAMNPLVRVVRIPDAGHLPWHDEPEIVAVEMEGFLAGSDDAS